MSPPSLAGHPVILTEICSYSSFLTLAQLLRVDKQLFGIAGRMLYRYFAYKPSSVPSPFHSYLAATPDLSIPSGLRPPDIGKSLSLIHPLLDFIEVLDIAEEDAVNLSDDYILHGEAVLPRMERLKTLILRSKDYGCTDPPELDCDLFLIGCKPERLVVIGGLAALHRISRYRRTSSGRGMPELPGREDTLWPSVQSLLHIIPYTDSHQYPSYFILREPNCDITSSLPKIQKYEVFFDINYIVRSQDATDIGLRDECNLARHVSWLVRNSRADLPITFFTTEETAGYLSARQGLINQTIKIPYRLVDLAMMPDREICREWKKEQFDTRVGCGKARPCGRDRELGWSMAADESSRPLQPSRLLDYVESMIGDVPAKERGDQAAKGDQTENNERFQFNFDFSMTSANDENDDEDFSMDEDDEDEEEEDESDFEDDPYEYRGSAWGGVGYGGYGGYGGYRNDYYYDGEEHYGMSDEDEDEEEEDEDDDGDEGAD